jgi:hypothetical protein
MRIWLHPNCGITNVAKSIIGQPTSIIVSNQNPVEGFVY